MIPGIHISKTIGPSVNPGVAPCNTCVFYRLDLLACLHETNVGVNYENNSYKALLTCQAKRVNSNDCGPEGKFYIKK